MEEPNNQDSVEKATKDAMETPIEDENNSGYESDASRTTTIDGYSFLESRTSSRIGSVSLSRSSSSSEEEEEETESRRQKSMGTKLKDLAQPKESSLKMQPSSKSSNLKEEKDQSPNGIHRMIDRSLAKVKKIIGE